VSWAAGNVSSELSATCMVAWAMTRDVVANQRVPAN
jgi:hypothetical protein